jgi:hypothetical protein
MLLPIQGFGRFTLRFELSPKALQVDTEGSERCGSCATGISQQSEHDVFGL